MGEFDEILKRLNAINEKLKKANDDLLTALGKQKESIEKLKDIKKIADLTRHNMSKGYVDRLEEMWEEDDEV